MVVAELLAIEQLKQVTGWNRETNVCEMHWLPWQTPMCAGYSD